METIEKALYLLLLVLNTAFQCYVVLKSKDKFWHSLSLQVIIFVIAICVLVQWTHWSDSAGGNISWTYIKSILVLESVLFILARHLWGQLVKE